MEFRALVRQLAEGVINDLGDVVDWHVTDIVWDPAPADASPAVAAMTFEVDSLSDVDSHVLNALRETSVSVCVEMAEAGSRRTYRVFLPVNQPAPIAVYTIAEQIQDHALENPLTYAMALPPCPYHPAHPLTPAVGTAPRIGDI